MKIVSGELLVLAFCLYAGHLVLCCKEGELSKAFESCDEYDECIAGSLVRQRCKLGEYFDGEKCTHFLEVKCTKEKCIEGMIYDRGSCANSYDVCFDGRLHREMCPALYKYNGRYCVPMESCQDDRLCTEGDVTNVDGPSYMECINGEYMNKFCDPGFIFEKITKTCQPIDINLKANAKASSFCDEGKRIPLSDCSKYQECVRGRWQDKECPKNWLFDKISQMCRLYWEATCGDDSCVDGTLIPDPNNCGAYYECQNGGKNPVNCGWFKSFDPVYQECTFAEHCERNKCTGDWVQVSKDCSQYTMCKNGYKITYSCPLFQKYKDGVCKLFTTCDQPNAFISLKKDTDQCTNNQTRRLLGRCTEYEKCINKRWKTMQCPTGTNFQTDKCEKKPCPLRPVLNHCSKFMQPESDKKYECPVGLLFDEIHRQCVHYAAAQCAKGECIDEEVVNHPTDCNKYKTCKKGKWEINSCPMLFPHFDITLKECRFWKYTCEYDTVNCTQNAIKPDPTNCKEYETCIDDSWRTNNCWAWQHFDSVSSSCATFGYKCYESPKQVTEAAQKLTSTKNQDTPKKYGSLVNSQVLASKCTEGEKKLVENTCRWYTECVDGQVITKKCSPCKNFNLDSKTGCDWVWKKPCKPGVTDPPDMTTTSPVTHVTTKPECKGSEKVGVKGDCHSYKECKDGKWVNEKCSVWGKFDNNSKECFYFQMWKVHCA